MHTAHFSDSGEGGFFIQRPIGQRPLDRDPNQRPSGQRPPWTETLPRTETLPKRRPPGTWDQGQRPPRRNINICLNILVSNTRLTLPWFKPNETETNRLDWFYHATLHFEVRKYIQEFQPEKNLTYVNVCEHPVQPDGKWHHTETPHL